MQGRPNLPPRRGVKVVDSSYAAGYPEIPISVDQKSAPPGHHVQRRRRKGDSHPNPFLSRIFSRPAVMSPHPPPPMFPSRVSVVVVLRRVFSRPHHRPHHHQVSFVVFPPVQKRTQEATLLVRYILPAPTIVVQQSRGSSPLSVRLFVCVFTSTRIINVPCKRRAVPVIPYVKMQGAIV